MKKNFLGITIILLLVLSIILVLVLITNKKKSIVGKWKAVDTESEYYYIFNDDKTCSYEMTVARLNCKYKQDNEKLTILYDGDDRKIKYEYRFQKDMLIIKDENGKDNKFVKAN